MRTVKVEPENVDQKLFETFSKLGYDGASMELLSNATGLKKASLYHRFPKGKKEMAQHVLTMVKQWIEDSVVAVAGNKQLKAETRLKKVMASVNELYNGGANNCLLRTLSIGPDAETFKGEVSECFDLVADGFAAIAVDLGNSPTTAKEKAKNINLLIQGSLVLAGATGDKAYFKNSISQIPVLLAAK
jgi:TetR/AcrR family transcriptional repressor of lmrAB and yxaGH operons